MSTHHHGKVYGDWRRANKGFAKLRREIAEEQVRRVPLEEYAVGSPRYERLLQAMAEHQQARVFRLKELWRSDGEG